MGKSTRVGRRVFVTECDCITIENNNPVKITVQLYGDYNDEKRASNAVRKQLGTEKVLVKDIRRTSLYYSMPIETFIKNADKVTKKD